jgi:hypothetical protein
VKPGGAEGAAVRQVGHSSVEDVVKQAQRSAFSLGNASADPMAKMANMSEGIKDRANQIYEFIQQLPGKIWDFVKELPSMIWDFITDLPQLMIDAIDEWWSSDSYDETQDPNSRYSQTGGAVYYQQQTGFDQLRRNDAAMGQDTFLERKLGLNLGI